MIRLRRNRSQQNSDRRTRSFARNPSWAAVGKRQVEAAFVLQRGRPVAWYYIGAAFGSRVGIYHNIHFIGNASIPHGRRREGRVRVPS